MISAAISRLLPTSALAGTPLHTRRRRPGCGLGLLEHTKRHRDDRDPDSARLGRARVPGVEVVAGIETVLRPLLGALAPFAPASIHAVCPVTRPPRAGAVAPRESTEHNRARGEQRAWDACMHASRHAAPQTHRLGRLVTGAPFVGVPSLTVLAAPPLGTSSSSRICADIEQGLRSWSRNAGRTGSSHWLIRQKEKGNARGQSAREQRGR